MLWALFISGLLTAGAAAEQVDFRAAFAPPHRITVGEPGGSVKTLLDAEPGALTIAWTYDDLRSAPLAVWKAPAIRWRVRLGVSLDGEPLRDCVWSRPPEGWPVLDMTWRGQGGSLKVEIAGSDAGAVGRVSIRNNDTRAHRFILRAEVLGGWVTHNPAWVNPARDAGALLAMQFERADRVLLAIGGGAAGPAEKKAASMEWQVAPGAVAEGWLYRPQEEYEDGLRRLRAKDWGAAYKAQLEPWRRVLAAAARFQIPDEGVSRAFRASLSDLYIMRERLAGGYTGTVCGTEIYRSVNSFEPSLAAIALDQMGLHADAAEGMRVHVEMQAPDGNWNDPQGWAQTMWGAAGMKSWAVMEHYRLTGDREYLARTFPKMLASSRWQAAQRARAGTGGLMPRGMGDGGLMNGTDHFGVFYPHNFLAVMADRLATEAAEILGRREEATELRKIHNRAREDVLRSLEKGAIESQGARWIPGSPGVETGSRWGALYSLFPARILPPRDPLIDGTLARIEAKLSEWGQPLNTGWMAEGTWAGITLDNLAEAHLMRGEGDASAAYLYSTLNHATPLVTWCEERGPEPGTKKTSGDRQHLWTPLAVVRLIRDSLVMEQDDGLHLALGIPRSWLESGRAVGVEGAPTHYGEVSFKLEAAADSLRAEITPPARSAPKSLVLHLRRPGRQAPRRIEVNGRAAAFEAECECVRLKAATGKLAVAAQY